MRAQGILIAILAAAVLQCGCGGGSSGSSSSSTVGSTTGTSGGSGGQGGSGGTSSAMPQFKHVLLVMEENHSYSDIIGNANMPYLNGLATANGLATQYYADAHPSLPNYFELTVGEGTSITGLAGDSYIGPVTQDNVVRALTAAGKTWKCYAEALPSVAYLGSDTNGYIQHHNPFVYLSDVQSSTVQAANVVPFTQFPIDLTNKALPDYAFIVPDINNDAHNCPAGMSSCTDAQKLANADTWLSTNIDPLLKSAAFQDSLLVIVFDESEDADILYGGGHVAAIIVSPLAKPGYVSTTLYQHESTLRLMLEGLGVTDLPGSAATAPDMKEFFQ